MLIDFGIQHHLILNFQLLDAEIEEHIIRVQLHQHVEVALTVQDNVALEQLRRQSSIH
jgi:hypothetical protein